MFPFASTFSPFAAELFLFDLARRVWLLWDALFDDSVLSSPELGTSSIVDKTVLKYVKICVNIKAEYVINHNVGVYV